MVGIIQEQHPQRARLFMQWQQMDWPILVDSYNLLGITVVPVVVLIDEHGIVREIGPDLENTTQLEKSFINNTFSASAAPAAMPPKTGSRLAQEIAKIDNKDSGENVSTLIQQLEKICRENPDDAVAHFRLGVAYRKRYDAKARESQDFQLAVFHWSTALHLDPNNYIWRRRLQQFGPRLEKPYPFYNWVYLE